jgi:hypothetical protein
MNADHPFWSFRPQPSFLELEIFLPSEPGDILLRRRPLPLRYGIRRKARDIRAQVLYGVQSTYQGTSRYAHTAYGPALPFHRIEGRHVAWLGQPLVRPNPRIVAPTSDLHLYNHQDQGRSNVGAPLPTRTRNQLAYDSVEHPAILKSRSEKPVGIKGRV